MSTPDPPPLRARARTAAVWIAVGAVVGLAIWLIFGRTAFVNYDSAWSLNWARDLVATLSRPNLDRPFSPTPHPLSDLLSLFLTPWSGSPGYREPFGAVGTDAETVLIVIALFFLGALGVVTFLLGRAWFGVGVGVVAAVLVLTREPVLSYGLRTYLDLPYAVFLLLALLAETRRPRNGYRTVAWLTLAGLLRPEAWLLTAAYVGYLVVAAVRDGDPIVPPRLRAGAARVPWRRLVGIVALALVAPIGWLLEGLVLAGDPLLALTGTQENAADLDRVTGVGSAVTVMPRRLGEIVREPVLLAAAGGVVLSLLFLRRRALLGVGAALAAGAAFFVLAAAGLPLLTRYLVFPATIVILFAAAGLLGWRRLPDDHPWRRRWQAFAAVALLAMVVFLPSQVDRLDRLQRALSLQHAVIGDLRTVAGDGLRPGLASEQCQGSEYFNTSLPERIVRNPTVALPNHRAVPQVRLWLGIDSRGASQTVQAYVAGSEPRFLLLPASERVARGFILDAADRGRPLPTPPAGSRLIARHGSWLVYDARGTDSAACHAAIRAGLR